VVTRPAIGLFFRAALLIALISSAFWISASIRDALDLEIMPHNEALMHKIIIVSLACYFILMSLPFLPGAEIGLTLLTVFGGAIAPAVYVATVLALALAFALGRLVPIATTARILRRLGQRRAADQLSRLDGVPNDQILDTVLSGTPARPLRGLIRFRYLVVMLLINTPGNIVVGGGGGIALVAGLSRCFHPIGFLTSVALAVLPVPLAAVLFSEP